MAAKRLGEKAEAQRLFDRALVELEAETGAPVRPTPNAFDVQSQPGGGSLEVLALAWAPGGQQLALAHGTVVSLVDRRTGRELRLEGHSGTIRSIAWSPNGKTVASASDDKTLRLWEVTSGMAIHKLEGHAD